MCILVLSVIHVILLKSVLTKTVVLGGIFDDGTELGDAFLYAVNNLNEEGNNGVIFTPVIQTVEWGNPYEASQAACSLIGEGVLGVFGPSTWGNIEGSNAYCDFKEIPQILVNWTQKLSTSTTLNMHPYPPVLARAYIDILQAWGWTKFIVLYENIDSFIRLAPLLEYAEKLEMYVIMRHLYTIHDDVFRTQLKEIRNSGVYNLLIDCSYNYLEEVLRQAQQVGLMTKKYNIFITNLDLHTLNLEDYRFSSVNLTGVRIVDPDSELVQRVSQHVLKEAVNDEAEFSMPLSMKLKSSVALLIDGVNMYAEALSKLDLSNYHTEYDPNCEDGESWRDGFSVLSFMKSSSFNGLTGPIQFDRKGLRTDFQLQIVELMEEGIVKVGEWNSSRSPRLKITHERIKPIEDDQGSLRNKTFRVSICLTEPYAMWKESPEHLEGNDQFEGYAIDLIDKLAEIEGFQPIYIARPDTDNGGRNSTGQWTGMVGDIVYGRADLAIADLTITSERQEAVDFTEPFMNLGIIILFQKPKKESPSFFSFAAPFAIETWLALLGSVFTVSLSLFVLARLSPSEWENPYPCIEEPEYLENQFHIKNSFWFTVGSLMQQGTELEPKGTTIRMIAGFWAFFILIMNASYTANLAAFLATENPIELFTSLEGLVENAEKRGIAYGCKGGGATYKFFKNAQNPLYQSVYEYMSNHPENMPNSNNAGVERAEEEKYAFFMETTSVDYAVQRHCSLNKVGQPMDANKGYGIALLKNSPYRKRLTLAILELQSSGFLDELKRRWWEERRGGGQCSGDATEAAEAQPMYLMHVEGVFYVTACGTVFALFMAIIEFLIGVNRLKNYKKISFKEALITELKIFLTFKLTKIGIPESPPGSASKSKSPSASKSKSKSRSRLASKSTQGLKEDSEYVKKTEDFNKSNDENQKENNRNHSLTDRAL